MAEAILNKESEQIDTSKDCIVVIKALTDIPGGRSLDVSEVPSEMKVLKAGHVIVKTQAGVYKPLSVNAEGTAYAEKAETDEYVGILKVSILVSDARAAIITSGQINAAASPFPVTSGIKTALPRIEFLY